VYVYNICNLLCTHLSFETKHSLRVIWRASNVSNGFFSPYDERCFRRSCLHFDAKINPAPSWPLQVNDAQSLNFKTSQMIPIEPPYPTIAVAFVAKSAKDARAATTYQLHFPGLI
jgi:hypothetical protein